MGRYHSGSHESAVICPNESCEANNAPPSAEEYDGACWRCGDPLKPEGEPEVGDDIVVDIVDTDAKGRSVGKTPSGFVVFLDQEVGALEARVAITATDDTSAHAELIDAL